MSTTRYFRGRYSFWKFETGKHPLTRPIHSGTWGPSIFINLEEFLTDTDIIEEITEGDLP